MKTRSQTISFKRIYLLGGVLGAILPILDYWKCGFRFPPSISESYYLGAIVPFTLILGSLGFSFICNEGYDLRDRTCNYIAGFAALGVVCFPCNSKFAIFHYISAILLFATFMFMCWFVFTDVRSNKGYTRNKNIRNFIYFSCGLFIGLGMLFAVFHLISLFWCETWMLEFYAIAYMMQGELIFNDK